jgi:hypothetical protein
MRKNETGSPFQKSSFPSWFLDSELTSRALFFIIVFIDIYQTNG